MFFFLFDRIERDKLHVRRNTQKKHQSHRYCHDNNNDATSRSGFVSVEPRDTTDGRHARYLGLEQRTRSLVYV